MAKGIKIILCTYCRGCNAFQLRHRFTLTFESLLKINSLIVHFLCLHEIIRICYLLSSCSDHNMISQYIYLEKGERRLLVDLNSDDQWLKQSTVTNLYILPPSAEAKFVPKIFFPLESKLGEIEKLRLKVIRIYKRNNDERRKTKFVMGF